MRKLGMELERQINEANEYYREKEIALIYKKPTPVQIVRVNYPKRSRAKIIEAYYKTPSTTDYNGIYQGLYIDFEAKETNSKTSFPLANIQPHQINHLKKVFAHKGIAFIIFKWVYFDKTYVMDLKYILPWYSSGRKSIPYSAFLKDAWQIKTGDSPCLNYLKCVDKIINAQKLDNFFFTNERFEEGDY